jgi:hypothetical protein
MLKTNMNLVSTGFFQPDVGQIVILQWLAYTISFLTKGFNKCEGQALLEEGKAFKKCILSLSPQLFMQICAEM